MRSTEDRCRKLIQQGTPAFFDAYLKGDDTIKKWFTGGGYTAAAGDAGKFETPGT